MGIRYLDEAPASSGRIRYLDEPADRSQFQTPEFQGGPNAPAIKQAQQAQKQAETATGVLDVPIVGANVANARLLGIPGLVSKATTGVEIPEASTSVGKLASDVGGLVAFGRGIEKMAIPAVKGTVSGIKGAGDFVGSRMAIGKELKDFQTQFGETIQGAKVPIVRLAQNIGDKVSKATENLSVYKKQMDDMIFKEAEKSASDVHSKLPTFFKNASTEYGKRLDDIASVLDKPENIIQSPTSPVARASHVTRQEAHDLVNNIKAEAVDSQLDIGPAFSKIDSILNKYPLAGENTGLVSNTGESLVKDMSSEPIPFKELNQAIREVMKKTSSSFKSGQRATPEDIAAMITKEHYGQFIANKLPPEMADSLQKLNQAYRPIAQARKELGRIFKPYNQFSEGDGANFLAKAAQNIASKDLSEGKAQLLDLLERGNELTPGIGDVTSRIKALGNSRIQNERQLNDFISDLSKKQKRVNDLIATKSDMDNKVKNVLKVIGLGGGIEEIGRRTLSK